MSDEVATKTETTLEFSLTVTVKGHSLQDIDDALVRAAGERLMKRMVNPPTLNGETLKKGETLPRGAQTHKKAQPESPEAHANAAVDAHTTTTEDPPAKRALKAVYEKHGTAGVMKVLNQFGAKRLGEIGKDQGEALVQACNAALENVEVLDGDQQG